MNQRTFLCMSAGTAMVAALMAAGPLAGQSSSVAAKPATSAASKSDAPFVAPRRHGEPGSSRDLDQRRYLGRSLRTA